MAFSPPTNPRDPRGGFPTRINQRIRVPEVFLIGPGGEQLGIVDTRDAQDRARAAGLDLVPQRVDELRIPVGQPRFARLAVLDELHGVAHDDHQCTAAAARHTPITVASSTP